MPEYLSCSKVPTIRISSRRYALI